MQAHTLNAGCQSIYSSRGILFCMDWWSNVMRNLNEVTRVSLAPALAAPERAAADRKDDKGI